MYMSEPILVNVTEEIVRGLVSFLLRGPEYQTFCKCEICELDTVAIALNALPSKYVTSMDARDEAFRTMNTPENIELVNREIIRALHVVNKYPRHK
nr:late competence development ComFB family protein [Lysinibacillus parviboronicapiens]